MGSLCAQEAMRIIHATLPAVLRDGSDLDLRARMAWGDTLAGISLATNAVVIPHVLAMVLGGRHGIVHGRAISSVTLACLRHSRAGAVPKLARIARLLDPEAEASPEGLADRAIDAVGRVIADIGMERSVAEHGVPEGEFEDIAREVDANFRTRIDADPVPTDAAGLVRILRDSARPPPDAE
jgi:alcohol dehydrogenase class IV